MTARTAFVCLLNDSRDPFRLLRTYQRVLTELFENPKWHGGPVSMRRVPWGLAEDLRNQTDTPFHSPGIYIWGVERKRKKENRPIYVGITRNEFRTRFHRYIWDKWSQCNLAQDYPPASKAKSPDGLRQEIEDWYKRHHKNSRVRLNGAARFAQEGIDNIWFALLPHSDKSEIRKLEHALIPVARAWNALRGYPALLNIQD